MRFSTVLTPLLLTLSCPAEITSLQAELISESSTAATGRTVNVGLHLQHPAGAHTYWKHPGIVGLATKIEWVLPPGVSAGETSWPAPQIVKMASYTAQGYEGETLLITPITVSADFKEPNAGIVAKVSWMCCGKTCKPENDIPLYLNLPVGPNDLPNAVTKPLFEKTRALIPTKDDAWQSSVKRDGDLILLTLKSTDPSRTRAVEDLRDVRFFTADGQVDSDQPQKTEVQADGSLVLRLHVSETAPKSAVDLPGVLEASNGWRTDGTSRAITIRPAY